MHEVYDSEILATGALVRAPHLGIVGGGQLAKMTALAALKLGCDVTVLERNSYSPAAQLATHSLVGDWDNPEALVKLASQVDVVSIENEFIQTEALRAIESCGYRLFPGTATLSRIQDKFLQKQTLATAGLPVPRFASLSTLGDLREAAREFGFPVVVKSRRNGYDGKGNYTARSQAELAVAWEKLRGDRNPLLVEAFCPYETELAVIITRGHDGATAVYPVVETVQRDHICHVVRAPAPISSELATRVAHLALRAIESIQGVGSFGVELFLTGDRQVLINELAPRVHNSGHYTIEACTCSQFENHVRAVLGWPLGSTEMIAPAAVMVNLLGIGKGPGAPRGLGRALAVPGAHLHVYGKAMSGAGRKMGHVTALGRDLTEAESRAQAAAGMIQFGGNEPS